MRKLLLALALAALCWQPQQAAAQVPCIGVGGVNTVPQVGISCAQEPLVSSYGATSVALVPVAAGATDFLCIGGATGKVIRVQAIRVAGTAGTLVNVPLLVMKHVSLDTGTASATTTMIPIPYAMDSNNAAAVAVTRAWITANPTIVDAAPGIIDSADLVLGTSGTILNNTGVVLDYRERNFMQAPTLRKATEEVCLNLNTTAVTAGLLYTTVQWTEQAQ